MGHLAEDGRGLIAAVDESRVGSRRPLLPRKKQLLHPIFFVPVASDV